MKLPDRETIEQIRAIADRRLSAAEFEAYLGGPMSDAEREDIHEKLDWFNRRYPTVKERLAWAKRAYERWTRSPIRWEPGDYARSAEK